MTEFHEGNSVAVQHLFKLHYRALVYFANKLINDPQEAEDIVINTFVKLLDKRVSFESLRNIKSFLYTTVRNSCLDYLRHMNRRSSWHKEISYLSETNEEVEDEMMKARILQEIYNEIETLPSQCRLIFKLIFINGLSSKQISEQLGITAKTVLNQKLKAVRLLKNSLLKKNLLPASVLIHLWMIFCHQMMQ